MIRIIETTPEKYFNTFNIDVIVYKSTYTYRAKIPRKYILVEGFGKNYLNEVAAEGHSVEVALENLMILALKTEYVESLEDTPKRFPDFYES